MLCISFFRPFSGSHLVAFFLCLVIFFYVRHYKCYIVKCLHFVIFFFFRVLKFVLAHRLVVRLAVDQLDIFDHYLKLCWSVPRSVHIKPRASLCLILSLDPSGVSIDCPTADVGTTL